MIRTALSGFAVTALLWSLLVFPGCISDQGRFNGIDISGHIRNQADSAAVPEALVIVDLELWKGTSEEGILTDSTGYFSYHIYTPTEGFDTIPCRVTVADNDGEANGLFLSKDTLLVEEHPDDSTQITFEVDIYVKMLE